MVLDPKLTRGVKRMRRRKPREEIVDYVVEIDGWDWAYSFSLDMERQPIDPYHDFRHLQINGRLMTPTGLKTDRVEISLLPSPELVEEKRKELTPIALGWLSLAPDCVLGNIGIPWDALTPILQMLIAGRFKFVLMRGTRFRHRSAKLNSLRLETKLTEDDPLPEEGVGGDPAAGLQASLGPEKIDAGGVVRGVGKGRSAPAGREG